MKFEKIKALRIKNSLKQKDVARKLKVAPSNYSRWEIGKEIIPLNKLNSLCNLYEVSMNYIVGFTNEKQPQKKCYINNIREGKRLKKFRKDYNLTQEELASFLGTTHSTISAYENGRTMILTIYAYKICAKYNVSMDWLCSRQ